MSITIPGIIYNCLLVNLVISCTGCCQGRACVYFAHPCEFRPPLLSPTRLLILCPSFIPLKQHWSPCCSSNMLGLLLPQGLCTCWAISPEGILTQISAWLTLIFFRPLLKVVFLVKTFLAPVSKTVPTLTLHTVLRCFISLPYNCHCLLHGTFCLFILFIVCLPH